MVSKAYIILKWWRNWKTFPVLSWVRAAALYRAGKFQQAEKLYIRGLDRHYDHPAHLCARLDLAYCLFRNGKLEEAEKELKFVVARSQSSREAVLRLARLQMWTGRSLDAAWTLKRAKPKANDTEFLALLLFAVLDNGGPRHLLDETVKFLGALPEEERNNAKVQAVMSRLKIVTGDRAKGLTELESVAIKNDAPFEAILLFAESLLEDAKVAHARLELRRALSLEANHPRVLSLMAEAYLKSGPYYNPEYASQLATSACQNSNWLSAREMHVLAESYYHTNDSVSALIMARKAKNTGSKLMGEYRYVRELDQLIENLGQVQTAWVKSKVL